MISSCNHSAPSFQPSRSSLAFPGYLATALVVRPNALWANTTSRPFTTIMISAPPFPFSPNLINITDGLSSSTSSSFSITTSSDLSSTTSSDLSNTNPTDPSASTSSDSLASTSGALPSTSNAPKTSATPRTVIVLAVLLPVLAVILGLFGLGLLLCLTRRKSETQKISRHHYREPALPILPEDQEASTASSASEFAHLNSGPPVLPPVFPSPVDGRYYEPYKRHATPGDRPLGAHPFSSSSPYRSNI